MTDREEMERKKALLQDEMEQFEEQRQNIIALSEKLAKERDKVLHEKAYFDADREQVMKLQAEIEFQKSILQADFLKCEEMEHKLNQRQNMLTLQFSKDLSHKDWS